MTTNHNCWTCRHDYMDESVAASGCHLCRVVGADERVAEWGYKYVDVNTGMPSKTAPRCPGWVPKIATKPANPFYIETTVESVTPTTTADTPPPEHLAVVREVCPDLEWEGYVNRGETVMYATVHGDAFIHVSGDADSTWSALFCPTDDHALAAAYATGPTLRDAMVAMLADARAWVAAVQRVLGPAPVPPDAG